MRFSTSAVLALPLLAAAAESPFEQYKAKFQNFISSFGGSLPSSAEKVAEPVAASIKAKTKVVAPKPIVGLTLHDYVDTLYSPVKEGATAPEEWLVLVTGQNKTCMGRCLQLDRAFNESAVKLASVPNSPHLARLDCDEQPVLCNSWSASTGALWLFQVSPKPAPVDVYWKPLNLTSVTTQTILDLQAQPLDKTRPLEEGGFRFIEPNFFHPFHGFIADNGLTVPVGYVLWGLNAIPSWAMMLVVSFFSRSYMTRGLNTTPTGRPAGAPAPAAAR